METGQLGKSLRPGEGLDYSPHPQDVDHASAVVGQHGEARFRLQLPQPAGQEVDSVHPAFDPAHIAPPGARRVVLAANGVAHLVKEFGARWCLHRHFSTPGRHVGVEYDRGSRGHQFPQERPFRTSCGHFLYGAAPGCATPDWLPHDRSSGQPCFHLRAVGGRTR